jgi:hypothetical protein
VQVNADLGKTVSALLAGKFSGRSNSGTSIATYHADCAGSATGQVKQFLTRHLCKQYAVEAWTITGQGVATQVSFSWVEMATASLAGQYKGLVDKYHTGNPPGVPLAFDGKCYASGQEDSSVWVIEVQSTGHAETDHEVLQAAAHRTLSTDYLGRHCAR